MFNYSLLYVVSLLIYTLPYTLHDALCVNSCFMPHIVLLNICVGSGILYFLCTTMLHALRLLRLQSFGTRLHGTLLWLPPPTNNRLNIRRKETLLPYRRSCRWIARFNSFIL